MAQRRHREKVFTFDFFEAIEDDDTEAVRCSAANHRAGAHRNITTPWCVSVSVA